MDGNVAPVQLVLADHHLEAHLELVVLHRRERRLVVRGLISGTLGDDLIGVALAELKLRHLAGDEAPPGLVNRPAIELDVLGERGDLAVRTEGEVPACHDRKELRDRKEHLESDSAHLAAAEPVLDFREVHAFHGVHRSEPQGAPERLAEDLVHHVLTLRELSGVTARAERLLQGELILRRTGLILERNRTKRAHRSEVRTSHRLRTDLVDGLLDAHQRLEVGTDLRLRGLEPGRERDVVPLLDDADVLRAPSARLFEDS